MFDKNKYKLNSTFINIDAIKETAKNPGYCHNYTIPMIYEFRPDLIAYSLYKDVSMAEYLAILNDIDDTPEGFYRGRTIRVLNEDKKGLV